MTHEQVAKALGVSVASVRQYRLPPEAKAYRRPMPGWRKALLQLARRRVKELRALIEELERD